MSIQDKVSSFNDLIQASFRNAMDTVEHVHQTAAEMPLDVLQELGYPPEKTATIKESHRTILRILYGGIKSAHVEMGKLVVMQAGELGKFANEMSGASKWQAQATSAPATKTVADTKAGTAKKRGSKKRATKKPTAKSAAGKESAGD